QWLKMYNIKIYSYTSHLVILLNTLANEEIIIKELAEIGIKKSGLRVVNNEMGTKEKFKEHIYDKTNSFISYYWNISEPRRK
ncbi:5775_t:CDS:2, partial [Gigaspora margarita]